MKSLQEQYNELALQVKQGDKSYQTKSMMKHLEDKMMLQKLHSDLEKNEEVNEGIALIRKIGLLYDKIMCYENRGVTRKYIPDVQLPKQILTK